MVTDCTCGHRFTRLGKAVSLGVRVTRRLCAGLMAHKARVLHGERTIRMHYANCATFNADFDGDEINLHLPQEQQGRAEGYEIVHADHQFKVRPRAACAAWV